MISFELSEDQKAMQTLAREFAQKEIKPVAAGLDCQADYTKCFSWELMERGSKLGFRTMTLAKKYGGPELDTLTVALVLEELAVADVGVAVLFAQTNKFVGMIQKTATDELCKKYLIPFRDDDRYLIAATSTEAELGSDLIAAYPDRRYTTTAVLDGNDWVINGVKQWSSGAPLAKLFRIAVVTKEGEAQILVPADTPGVRVGHIHHKIGERFALNAEMIYENVRVPKTNILGKPRAGKPDPTSRYMQASNVFAAATALGVGRAAYETALEYAKNRKQGGKKIIEHQAIGMMLADMFIELEAARALYWKASWATDHQEAYDPKIQAMVKPKCSEIAMRTALRALEIHGGYGSTTDFPIEKIVRDAAAFLHSDGTRQAFAVRAANCLAMGL